MVNMICLISKLPSKEVTKLVGTISKNYMNNTKRTAKDIKKSVPMLHADLTNIIGGYIGNPLIVTVNVTDSITVPYQYQL